jgi:branched-chain amino acid transport system permease protein
MNPRQPINASPFVGHWAWRWMLFLAALMLLAPWVFSSPFAQAVLTQIGIAIVACLSYNMLLGQGGMLSFGHAVYTGLGAYMAMHVLQSSSSAGWSVPVSLIPLVGGVCGMGFAVVLGYVTTRRSGTTLAMITLGMAELVFAMSLMFSDFFGGEAGLSGNRVQGPALWGIDFKSQTQVYVLIAAYTWMCVGLMYAFTQTPLGRLLNAVRDNAERLSFIGYQPQRVRYLAFIIAGFFAGVSGGMAVLHFEIVTAEVVGAARSGAYLLFTFLGGSGYFVGPILGAVGMVLSAVLLSEWTAAWLLYLGVVFVAMVMYAPGGLASIGVWHVRWVMQAGASRLWGWYLGCLTSAAVATLGAASAIEMFYHHQLQSSVGQPLRWLGQLWATDQPWPWVLAAMTLLIGLAGWRLFKHQWDKAWETMASPNSEAKP